MGRLSHILALLALGLVLTLPIVAAQGAETADPASCYALDETPVCITEAAYTADVCAAIEKFAQHYALPEGFFARLIWQESRFDPQAISPAGAQGIAQFMPGTARLRDLGDPFDPAEALARSAEYLRFLELKFGNLGLAAAAYNGGEGKIARFITGSGVARETRAYVSIITGRPIDYWLGDTIEPADYALSPDQSFNEACITMAKALPMPTFGAQSGEWQPWGVLIAQNYSAELARSAFTRMQDKFDAEMADKELLLLTIRNPSFGKRLRYSAQVGFPERQAARDFCRELVTAGGNCIVQKNGD